MKKEGSIQSKKKTDILNSLKLFKVLGLLYLLHFLKPVTSLLNPPRNLSVVSENFIHLLTWEAGADAPLTTRYTVEYFSLSAAGESFRAVNCWLIVNRTCDLTDEFSDIYGNYWPQVKAVVGNDESNWTTMDIAFQPYDDTHIRPLNVQLVESPLGVLNVTFDIAAAPPLISQSLDVKSLIDIYMKLRYHITVYKDGKLEKSRDLLKITSETSIEEIFENVEPNTKYCITINIFYLKEQHSDPLERKCIITQYAEEDEGTEVSRTLLAAGFCILGIVLIIIMLLYKAGCLSFLSTYVPQSLKNLKYTHAIHNYNDTQEKFSTMGHVCVSKEKMQDVEEESEEEELSNVAESAYEHNSLPITMQDSAQSSLFSDKATDGTSAVACDDQQFNSFTNFDNCLMAPTDVMQNESTETEIMSQLQINHSRKSSSSPASVDTSDVPLCSVQIQDSDCCFVEFSNEQMCDQETCESNTTENNEMTDSLTSEVYDNTVFYQSENPVQCDVSDCSSLPLVLHSNYMRR
ncbi:interferon lambda receptor 1-like [Pristis pectinata]|uniref:interferon lambda receptor 1-like n=1 Tax=Pristis pectinata TaxID=685728 RepID=UPI00223E1D7E|nr:interferon lambda receptor 1-like [Pristis pectinata]XP_051870739.1 interferon lambda receptor 1-like [Pristis pectinata]